MDVQARARARHPLQDPRGQGTIAIEMRRARDRGGGVNRPFIHAGARATGHEREAIGLTDNARAEEE
ncbi:MAG: hypothetical protein O6948_01125 [Deltaproteobacteria bacterium]|nr:hypothetical protein [Deltaproteobacteria bacterium]